MKTRIVQKFARVTLLSICMMWGITACAVTVTVDENNVLSEVPRTLYGTGMEDVNHEIYGGLDAQRLYDESFEEELPLQVEELEIEGRADTGIHHVHRLVVEYW